MKKPLIILTFLVILGCTREAPQNSVPPDVIRVAVLPSQSAEQLNLRHQPLLDYLEQKTAIRFELTIAADYEDLLRAFEASEIDLAWFGGLTFVRAAEQGNAAPLVFREIDLQFTSCYVTNKNSKRTSVSAFEGEDFTFGPKLSTSGHLMPRYFMVQRGLVPEEVFSSVRYSNGHNESVASVVNGSVEIAVANCFVVRSILNTNPSYASALRILETTPPYANDVWATQTSMDDSTRLAILDAFLALDATVPAHREILQRQGASSYLPAANEDYASVRAAAEQLGLLTGGSQP